MTIPVAQNWAKLSGHTGTGPLNFTFLHSGKPDLRVFVVDAGDSPGESDELGQGDFTLTPGATTGAGLIEGGAITLVSSVTDKDVWVIRRWVKERTSNFSVGAVSGSDLNGPLDELWGALQDLEVRIENEALLGPFNPAGNHLTEEEIAELTVYAGERFDIRRFGASTSTADNGAFITAAIAAASAAGGYVYVPEGDFPCTTDVPTIHDVELRGPGSIKIGTGRPWRAEPSERNTTFGVPMTLYVDPAGSDANSGLAPEFPLATLQKAADILDLYKAPLLGFWRIILAAGTYTAKADFVGMQNTFENPLYISGPTPASAWDNTSPPASSATTGGSVPTAILDGTGDGAGWAIDVRSQSHVVVEYVKATDWGTKVTGNDEGAFRAKDWSSIRLVNCHVWACSKGAEAREHSDIILDGGFYDARTGLKAIMSRYSVLPHTSMAGDPAAPLIRNATLAAVDAWEGATGHADWLIMEDCATGVYVRKGGYAALRGPTFRTTSGTMVGIKAEGPSSFFPDGTEVWDDDGGTFIRYRIAEASPDGREESRSWRQVAADISDQTTVDQTALDLITYDIEPDSFVEEGQAIRVKIFYSQSIPNANAPFEVRLQGAAATVTAPTSASAGLQGYCEFVIYAKTATTQFYHARTYAANTNNASVFVQDIAAAALTEDMTAARTLTVRVTCGHDDDEITVHGVTIERMG